MAGEGVVDVQGRFGGLIPTIGSWPVPLPCLDQLREGGTAPRSPTWMMGLFWPRPACDICKKLGPRG